MKYPLTAEQQIEVSSKKGTSIVHPFSKEKYRSKLRRYSQTTNTVTIRYPIGERRFL